MMGEMSVKLDAKFNSYLNVYNIIKIKENSKYSIESKSSQQGGHSVISEEVEVVQQCNNLLHSLQTQCIHQVHILKLRVLFTRPKVQGISFKCKAKMAWYYDEKSFINKEPKIEMKNMVGSMKNLQESFEALLYLIINWKWKKK